MNLGWKNLETQRLIKKAVMVYKSLNCLAPVYLSSKFIQRKDIFNSITLELLKISLLFPHIRQAKSLTSFRQLLTSNSNTAFMENRL